MEAPWWARKLLDLLCIGCAALAAEDRIHHRNNWGAPTGSVGLEAALSTDGTACHLMADVARGGVRAARGCTLLS